MHEQAGIAKYLFSACTWLSSEPFSVKLSELNNSVNEWGWVSERMH